MDKHIAWLVPLNLMLVAFGFCAILNFYFSPPRQVECYVSIPGQFTTIEIVGKGLSYE